ncbi:MAG: CoA transferase [Acidimicrobiales bacterium]
MTADTRSTDAGPLAGTLVIDLTRVLSGPYCTMMLADLGARVIKVERPEVGDDARHIGPFTDQGSAYFESINRGKESIELDLSDADDRAFFDQLLDAADVVVENFRPGAFDRLGYDWETLHRRWPSLILASVSGFGHSGPLKEQPAYDMIVQAMGGVMSITGEPGGNPTRVGTSIGDICAGMFTATSIIAALHQRTSTGIGARVDVAMLDAQVALLENAIARYTTSGVVPGPIGSRHPSITPFGAFATKEGSVVIAAGNDGLFATLAEAIGAPELAADPRFATNDDRCTNEPLLRPLIEQALASAPATEWVERLSAAGLPTSLVHNVEQVLHHPQTVARNMALVIDGTDGQLVAGNPMKISTLAERSVAPRSPVLGQHGEAIRAEFAPTEEPTAG